MFLVLNLYGLRVDAEFNANSGGNQQYQCPIASLKVVEGKHTVKVLCTPCILWWYDASRQLFQTVLQYLKTDLTKLYQNKTFCDEVRKYFSSFGSKTIQQTFEKYLNPPPKVVDDSERRTILTYISKFESRNQTMNKSVTFSSNATKILQCLLRFTMRRYQSYACWSLHRSNNFIHC